MDPKTFNFAGQGKLQRIAASWSDWYCAEHDGSIAAFDRLDMRLKEIENFRSMFEDRKTNYARFTGAAAGAAAVSALVAVTVATGGAAAVAAALGASGALGAAGTGTAIASLSGAALTSASLAALGGGSMAVGGVVVTAVGAALGAGYGGVLSNRYFGEVKGFNIVKQKEGGERSIVFTNGFLTEREEDCLDWKHGIRGRFDDASWYFARWESKSKRKIGQYICSAAGSAAVKVLLARLAASGRKTFVKKLNPLVALQGVLGATANAWHTSMFKAMKTGALLADVIARTPEKRYVLMGHSLGARAIYYALLALSTRSVKVVENAYLLGGAVDRTDIDGWKQAAAALRSGGRIFNCYSKNDKVLGRIYRAANARQSDPVGFAPIENCPPAIVNVDCTDLIDGHSEWKAHLAEVLLRADAVSSNAQPTDPETIQRPISQRESARQARWTVIGAAVALIVAVASVLGFIAMLR